MAKKIPVIICNIKQRPKSDPKFHRVEILDGEGKSIRELLIIFNNGDSFRIGIFISLFVVKDHI